MDQLGEDLAGVAALGEPTRRSLYDYVVTQPSPVSREQAAEAVGMPVHSVKFHLDKLVAAGLLEVEYRRLTGRTGPGAGRPAKLYRRSERQVAVSLPPRHYRLAGSLLAAAIERTSREGIPVADAVHAVAREEGRRLAGDAPAAPDSGGDAPGSDDHDLSRVLAVLKSHGYEPRVGRHTVSLANCPFDLLAAEHTELVCGMNLSLLGGVLEGLDAGTLRVRLAPAPGLCCVRVERTAADPDA